MTHQYSPTEELLDSSQYDYVFDPSRPRWRRAIDHVSNALSEFSGVATIVLMLMTVGDVFLRKFFQSGLPGTIEISEVVLVGLVFLAMMSAELNNTHVRTPLVTERLPPRPAAIVRLIGMVPALVFVAWMTYLTATEGLRSWGNGEFRFGLVFVPVWPAKLIIPIGLAGLTIALALKVVQHIQELSALTQANNQTSHDSTATEVPN